MNVLTTTKKRNVRNKLWVVVPVLLLGGGLYILVTALAPSLPPVAVAPVAVQQFLAVAPDAESRIFIPKIDVSIPIVEGESAIALEKGAWHRRPQNGNPEKGGNFVLSAHRFELGLTPQQTRAKSPFYHIDKLAVGDKMYVDYNKKRFAYEVTKKYKVDRTAAQIEAPSADAKMTLYSCDLRGEAAGREVVEAKPVVFGG